MGSVFIKDLTDTWNSSGTAFQGIKLSVSDSTTATACNYYIWACGSTGRFQVNKNGLLQTCPLIMNSSSYLNGIGSYTTCPGNTLFGHQALYRIQDMNCTNYVACYNTAFGLCAGIFYTTAGGNSLLGAYAGANTTAQPSQANSRNIHVGSTFSATYGYVNNCALMVGFGTVGQCGEFNVALGAQAGGNSAAGGVAVGGFVGCCTAATHTLPNIGIGYNAGKLFNSGGNAISIGNNANGCSCAGGEAVAIGNSTGATNVNTRNNEYSVFIGYVAGLRNNGNSNTVIGAEADCFGDQCCGFCSTFIGYKAGLKAARSNPNVNNEIGVGFCAAPTTSFSYHHTVWGNSSNNVCNCVYAAWSNVSDCRDKTCIKNLPETYGLTFINKLKPSKFKWDNRETYVRECKFEYGCKDGTLKGKKFNYGFIAQDVKETINELGISFDALRYTEENDSYRLTYTDFISPLTLAVQQLACRIDALED